MEHWGVTMFPPSPFSKSTLFVCNIIDQATPIRILFSDERCPFTHSHGLDYGRALRSPRNLRSSKGAVV